MFECSKGSIHKSTQHFDDSIELNNANIDDDDGMTNRMLHFELNALQARDDENSSENAANLRLENITAHEKEPLTTDEIIAQLCQPLQTRRNPGRDGKIRNDWPGPSRFASLRYGGFVC